MYRMYRMKSESPVANNDSKTHVHLFLSCSSCTSCLKNLLRHEFAIAKTFDQREAILYREIVRKIKMR